MNRKRATGDGQLATETTLKVLLLAINKETTPFPVYPLGVDYVATALRGRYDVRVLDLGAEEDDGTLPSVLEQFRPGVVGISIRNVDNAESATHLSYLGDLERVVQTVRAHSQAKIVLGGAGFSIFPEALMSRARADFGVVGEGERLVELLDALQRGDSPRGLEGVVLPNESVRVPPPWPGPYVRELASKSTVAHYLRTGGMLNLQTKRGCPYRCTYCTYPVIEGRKLRLFDPDQVAREWASLIEAQAKFVFLTDSVFNSHVGHNLRVAGKLLQHGTIVPWGAFFAPTRPPRDYYRTLRDAGLTHVEFGTESLSAPMLRAFRKPFSPEHVLQAHAAALDAGLHVAHYIMLGGPGETLDTARETLQRCDQLENAVFFVFVGVRVYPSTELYRIACDQGVVSTTQEPLTPCFYLSPTAPLAALEELVHNHAGTRRNWVCGSGGEKVAALTRRMYARGAIGPLWERMLL